MATFEIIGLYMVGIFIFMGAGFRMNVSISTFMTSVTSILFLRGQGITDCPPWDKNDEVL